MQKEIPKYHETFIPILSVLNEKGLLQVNDLKKEVCSKFYGDLPEDLLEQRTNTGDILIFNRIGWGKSYLKQAEMLEQPERGLVKITEKGKKVLISGELTLKDLLKDADYLKNQHQKDNSKDIIDVIDENYSPDDMLSSSFNIIRNQVKIDLLEQVRKMNPYQFEVLVLKLFKAMGYGEFKSTPKSGDGGIDGIIYQDQLGLEKIYIQSKRYSEDNKIREPLMRDFIGAMSRNTKKGIFVTTSSFDEGAIKKAEEAEHSIILVDSFMLAELMYNNNIGLQTKTIYEVKKVDEDFFIE